jgi:PAS domain S-box-containing protein
MLWLYLLAAVTVLVIALRRVLRRQKPLDDELYSKNVAVEHVQSGVAWIRADGTISSVNQSFARTFRCEPQTMLDQEWYKLFPESEHAELGECFRQMLLAGMASFDGPGLRGDKSRGWLNVRLVAVHDHNMRFVGHHCLVEDRSRIRELEDRLLLLTSNAERTPITVSIRPESPTEEALQSRKSRQFARA